MKSFRDRTAIRAMQGAIAAIGAPLGWLGIRWLQGADPVDEVSMNAGLYLYMLMGTVVAFFTFGWYVGTKEQFAAVLALRDTLTGLFNVRYFRERLLEEIEVAKRYQTPLTLISFDLDHFKQVNDTYGHTIGDEVLIAVSHAASEALRKHEVLARVGGEEFIALLPRCNLEDGKETAERLRKIIAAIQIKTKNEQVITVTVSLGVAALRDTDDARTIFDRADVALYQAKVKGRNCVEVA